jgi:hypothetical protein
LGFLRLCGGQCVGADDGRAEQRKSVAQGISRYVVNKVVITIRPCMSENRFAATALVSAFGGMYGVKRYRTKTKVHAYLYLSDRSRI